MCKSKLLYIPPSKILRDPCWSPNHFLETNCYNNLYFTTNRSLLPKSTSYFLSCKNPHYLSIWPGVLPLSVFKSVHKFSLISGSIGPLLNTEPLSPLCAALSSPVAVALCSCPRHRSSSLGVRRGTLAGRQHVNRGVYFLNNIHLNPVEDEISNVKRTSNNNTKRIKL